MGDIELNTPDRLEYTFFPNSTGYIRFKVRAANDAHVALSTASAECDPMYEIFIGGWANQRSVIRKNRTKPDKAEAPTPNILHPGEFRTFWIRWDNNTVSCGCEDNPQPFVSWRDTEYVPIRYVGVCTAWGASGSWIIHQSGAPLGGFGAQPGFGGQPGGYGGQPGYGGQTGFQGQPAAQYGQPSYPPPSAPGQQYGNQPGAFAPPMGGYGGAHTWVPSGNGSVPPNAFVGGDDKGEPMYVVRCNFKGAMAPGKLLPSHRNAYVSWGGAEHPVPQYEVLCNFNGRWVSCTGGNIPQNAFSAGQSETGEPLYVGRVNNDGCLTVGKVQRSHNCCYIPYGGQELNFQQYEILTL